MDNIETRALVTFVARELKNSGDGTQIVLGHLLNNQADAVSALVTKFFSEDAEGVEFAADVPTVDPAPEVEVFEVDENGARG